MTVYSPEQVADFAFRAGFRGDALTTMVAVVGAESSYDSDAVGDVRLENATWGPSIGLGQVRTLKAERGTGSDRDEDVLRDPERNLLACYHISGGGSSFHPWSTFTNGAYTAHLGDAGAAASSTTSRGSSPNAWSNAPPPRTDDRLQAIGGYGGSPVASPDFPTTIRGRTLDGNLEEYAVSGHVSLDASQIWQMVLVFDDPGLSKLWESGIFDIDTPVDTADIRWKVAAVEVRQGPANEQVEVTARTAGAKALKADRSPKTETDVNPFEYVAHEAAAVGLIVTGGKVDRSLYANRPSIGRNPANAADPTSRNESGWEAIQRIAKEVGAWCWEGGESTLYFGAPRRFVADLIGFRVVWRPGPGEEHLAPLGCPRCRRTDDDPLQLAEVTVTLPPSRGRQVRPGMGMTLAGVKGFEETYIVSKVEWDFDRDVKPVTVTAITPRDPLPTDTAEQATNPETISLAGAAGSRSSLEFVKVCLKQAGKQYIYGAEAGLDDPDPQAFDCSELVQWATHQVGVDFPDGSGAQYEACRGAGLDITVDAAYATRGALLFMGPGGSEHVAVSLGDGASTIEARGRAYGVTTVPNVSTRGFTLAGLIPNLQYQGQDPGVLATTYIRKWGRPS